MYKMVCTGSLTNTGFTVPPCVVGSSELQPQRGVQRWVCPPGGDDAYLPGMDLGGLSVDYPPQTCTRGNHCQLGSPRSLSARDANLCPF